MTESWTSSPRTRTPARPASSSGTATAPSNRRATTGRATAHAYEVAVGDFNHDGKRDLAVACWGGSAISILLGNGNGTFEAKTDIGSGSAPHSLVVGRFNAHTYGLPAVANHDGDTVGNPARDEQRVVRQRRHVRGGLLSRIPSARATSTRMARRTSRPRMTDRETRASCLAALMGRSRTRCRMPRAACRNRSRSAT